MASLPAVKQMGSEDSTSLSPRLRHLLIQEDRSTGKLYIPAAAAAAAASSSARPSSQGSSSKQSPPGSPFAFPNSPYDSPAHLPRPLTASRPPHLPSHDRILPGSHDRRPSGSITSLLGPEGNPRQPLPAPTSFHRESRYDHPLRASAPSISFIPHAGPGAYTAPHTCPIEPTPSSSGRDSPFLPVSSHHYNRPSTTSSLSRGDYVRRHSGEVQHQQQFQHHGQHQHQHPYRHAAAPYPSPNTMTSNSHHATSSRAPISRTTKACNACRNRKVRCDAGGVGAPEGTQCSRCRDAGIECIYSGIQKKRGPCPGSMRPTGITQKGGRRGSSTRSSIASIAPVTPPEDHLASGRNSYGFSNAYPKPHGPHQPFNVHPNEEAAGPAPRNYAPLPSPREQIHSWPGPAEQRDKLSRSVVFDEHYSMATQARSREQQQERERERERESVVLPPLRIAIGHKENYYE